MLCSRYLQIILTRVPAVLDRDNVQCRCLVRAQLILKQCQLNQLFTSLVKNKREVPIMSVRFLIRDLGLNKLRNVWMRKVNVSNVVKRYRRDRSVREVFLCFRQTFFRSRGTILLSATAACKGKDDDKNDGNVKLPSCTQDITDEELQSMLDAFDGIEELSQTIFCPICNKRVMIDRRLSTIKYCTCKEASTPTISKDGWEPYVEAEDTIIWRKEYKVGQGLFAYKVYGRYKEVLASDYAAVNIDTAYRKQWDNAVADLSVIERSPTVAGQAIIHWEVLWPRLFANRDYVYIRRHKEYNVHTRPHNPLEERSAKTEPLKTVDVSNPNKVIIVIIPENNQDIPPIRVEIDTSCNPEEYESAPEPNDNNTQTTKTVAVVEEKPKPKQETMVGKPKPKQETMVEKPKPKQETMVEKPKPKQETMVEKPKPKEESKKPETTKKVVTHEPAAVKPAPIEEPERPSVHSNAKRKSQDMYSKLKPEPESKDNKVYVILSKSCSHPKVPETRNAIRVTEYWSQMVVRSTDGANNNGMEFVLTYYDEPAVGGLPSGVSSWASGRAAPTYLDKMREAAKQYDAYRLEHGLAPGDLDGPRPKPVSYREPETNPNLNEQDMESSKQGPELVLDKDDLSKKDTRKKPIKLDRSKDELRRKNEATQTEVFKHVSAKIPDEVGGKANVKTTEDNQNSSEQITEDDAEESKRSWWPNPFYFLN